MEVRVDPRGMASLGGTMTFDDLEPLPRVSHTFLLQCGIPEPTGIVKWTGVCYRDFVGMLGVQEHTLEKGYCRFVGSDSTLASTRSVTSFICRSRVEAHPGSRKRFTARKTPPTTMRVNMDSGSRPTSPPVSR